MTEAESSRWQKECTAILFIIFLENFLQLSILNYYTSITKTGFEIGINKPIVFLPFTLIMLINYLAFSSSKARKRYVEGFDQLPKNKNRIGSWIVFGIVFFVIANLIFSFYILAQIDCRQYS